MPRPRAARNMRSTRRSRRRFATWLRASSIGCFSRPRRTTVTRIAFPPYWKFWTRSDSVVACPSNRRCWTRSWFAGLKTTCDKSKAGFPSGKSCKSTLLACRLMRPNCDCPSSSTSIANFANKGWQANGRGAGLERHSHSDLHGIRRHQAVFGAAIIRCY